MSPSRIVAGTTLRVLVRRLQFWIALVLYPLAAGIAAATGRFDPIGESRSFMTFLVLLLTAGIVGDDIDTGHLQLITTKPISRASYLLGRAAGALVAISVPLVLGGVAAAAIPGDAPTQGVALACALELLRIAGWVAAMTSLSVVVPRSWNALVALVALIAWQFVGFLVQFALGAAWTARLDVASDRLTPPDFSPLVADLVDHQAVAWSEVAYGVFYVAAALCLGAILLGRREIAARRA